MHNYLGLLNNILEDGFDHPDRTKTGRRSIYGPQLRFDLTQGFPLVTTREVPTSGFIHELLWHISGSNNVNELNAVKVRIWDGWAVRNQHIDDFIKKFVPLFIRNIPGDELKNEFKKYLEGRVGNIYGPNWRNIVVDYNELAPKKDINNVSAELLAIAKKEYDKVKEETDFKNFEDFLNVFINTQIDQLQNLIDGLKTRPYSSRHVISSWVHKFIPNEDLTPQENVLLGYGALAPCPTLMQYFVSPPKDTNQSRLSMQLYIRSADVPIGTVANVAQYALKLAMVAQVVDMQAYELIVNFGDAHIYSNQIELVKEQLLREPLPLAKLVLNPAIKNIDDFKFSDIKIENYQAHPAIKFPISV